MRLCLSESSLRHRMSGKAELREGTLPTPPAMEAALCMAAHAAQPADGTKATRRHL